MRPIPIVYQHTDFIIVNKPAGISVHRENDSKGLLEYLQPGFPDNKLYLVHRLDKVTSGLLIIALCQKAASELSQAFALKQVKKIYLAISDKKPRKKQGVISGDMDKSRNGKWMLKRSNNNPATTRFFSYAGAPGQRLYILRPYTGKTHQLRVAMKSIGAAILGDKGYSGSDAERVMLHAYALQFNYQHQSINAACWPEDSMMRLLSLDKQLHRSDDSSAPTPYQQALENPFSLRWPD